MHFTRHLDFVQIICEFDFIFQLCESILLALIHGCVLCATGSAGHVFRGAPAVAPRCLTTPRRPLAFVVVVFSIGIRRRSGTAATVSCRCRCRHQQALVRLVRVRFVGRRSQPRRFHVRAWISICVILHVPSPCIRVSRFQRTDDIIFEDFAVITCPFFLCSIDSDDPEAY